MKGDFEQHRHEAECRQTLRLWRGVLASVGKTLADRWLMDHLAIVRRVRGEVGEEMLRDGMKKQEHASLAAEVTVIPNGFALIYPWGEVSVWHLEEGHVPKIRPGAFFKKGDTDRFFSAHRQKELIAA